jgi:hypothetical protein
MGTTEEELLLEEGEEEEEGEYRYTEAFLSGNLICREVGPEGEVRYHSVEWENDGRKIVPVEVTCDVGEWTRAGRGEVRDGIGGESAEVLSQVDFEARV